MTHLGKLGRALAGVLLIGTLWAGTVGVAYAEGESEEAVEISVAHVIEYIQENYGGCDSGCQGDVPADGYFQLTEADEYP